MTCLLETVHSRTGQYGVLVVLNAEQIVAFPYSPFVEVPSYQARQPRRDCGFVGKAPSLKFTATRPTPVFLQVWKSQLITFCFYLRYGWVVRPQLRVKPQNRPSSYREYSCMFFRLGDISDRPEGLCTSGGTKLPEYHWTFFCS